MAQRRRAAEGQPAARTRTALLPRLGVLLRRHRLFAILLTAGFLLRLITWVTYRPSLLYIDSFRYLANHDPMRWDNLHPIGYNLILKPLLEFGGLFGVGLAFTTAVQHLLGLAVAVLLYWLARGLGTARWVSALITAPILLDAYQLQIEQNIMAEVWTDALLVGVLWLLLDWRLSSRITKKSVQYGPQLWQAAAAGALIAFNTSVRTIGIVVLIPFVLYLISAGARWRDRHWLKQMVLRVLVGLAGFGLIFGGYLIGFKADTGRWGLVGSGPVVLYGRAATVAKCDELPLDKYLAQLCPKEPIEDRLGVDWYSHGGIAAEELPPGKTQHDLKTEFGWLVVREQPLDLVWASVKDFFKGFAWTRTTSPKDVPLHRWQFQLHYPRYGGTPPEPITQRWDGTDPDIIRPFAQFLRGYQLTVGYTPGTLLGLAMAAGIAGIFYKRGRLRAESMLAVGIPLVLLAGAAGFEFSWRYQLPALVFVPLVGAVGVTALLERNRTRRPKMPDYPDRTDDGAHKSFAATYGDLKFPDLVVLIAAYNEERGIGNVLERMPKTCPTPDGGELEVATLVVVDGSTDRTAEVAAEHGAYVCVAPNNRGQGGALRLGYRLAVERGAKYVVTTDADGQYEIDELPDLMRPILTDQADFVTGSRRLGSEEADSQIRWVGVRVFATLASLLTRQRITDTSFGFRAMTDEVAGTVRLIEPQYQASELLMSVIGRGFRVVEVPLTMRLRNSGETKKGGSITYGANYGRVMVGSWLRECVFSRENRRLRRAAHHRRAGRSAAPAPGA